MSDQDVREAERRWRASGSIEDEAAWLHARVRAGVLPLGRVHAAAFLGDPAARLVEPPPWPEDVLASRSSDMSEAEARLYALFQHTSIPARLAREWLCRAVFVDALPRAEEEAHLAAVEVHDDAARHAGFAAMDVCVHPLADNLPTSSAREAVGEAGGDVAAEARWQVDELVKLLLA